MSAIEGSCQFTAFHCFDDDGTGSENMAVMGDDKPWKNTTQFDRRCNVHTSDIQLNTHSNNMWQSRVEIKHYSVVYFDHITTFEVL